LQVGAERAGCENDEDEAENEVSHGAFSV
jgi:hypothetical protein